MEPAWPRGAQGGGVGDQEENVPTWGETWGGAGEREVLLGVHFILSS